MSHPPVHADSNAPFERVVQSIKSCWRTDARPAIADPKRDLITLDNAPVRDLETPPSGQLYAATLNDWVWPKAEWLFRRGTYCEADGVLPTYASHADSCSHFPEAALVGLL